MQKDRKDFEKWKIREKYMEQEGLCAMCGASLERGFHAHHLNGDHSDNRLENLQLLCPSCHYSTFKKKQLERHRRLEKKTLRLLQEAMEKAMKKEINGSDLERILSVSSRILSISRTTNELNDPAIILPDMRQEALEQKAKDYFNGYKDGITSATQFLKYRLNKEEESS
ncbi:MAG: HNH endonuclease signature motif containing protein [Candidatus Njordarchaeales archaeon]